jgi:hypothetical protein
MNLNKMNPYGHAIPLHIKHNYISFIDAKPLITYLATCENPWHGKLKQFYLDY